MKGILICMKLFHVFFVISFFATGLAAKAGGAKSEPASEKNPKLIQPEYEKGKVTQLCTQAIKTAQTKFDALVKVPEGKRNFDNTVLAYESISADFSDAVYPLIFMGYVSKNEETSKEGSDCEVAVGGFSVEINARKDIYLVLRDQKPRTDDEKRLFTDLITALELSGLKLPDEQLAELVQLKTKLALLESTFSTNLNGDVSVFEITKEEAAGLPESYVAELTVTKDGAGYIVGTRENDRSTFLNNASNSNARKKFLLAYSNRQAEANTKLLEEAIVLRQKIAKLMGYSTWADYRIQGRMAKNSTEVLSFLNGLKAKLAERNKTDFENLLAFKKTLDASATQVDAWDTNYLSYQLKKKNYSVDEEKIREYFPADVVVAGVFNVYSQLLGVKFVEVKEAKVWSSDVQLYKIIDSKTNTTRAYFYTDFVPRDKKYGHAAAFQLISGRNVGQRYRYPVSSIVANFNPPTKDKPSLLSHYDVETLFHEFGHIMHQTLTRAPYASLSGSNTAQDFVEAPSQMLENWVWDESILSRISGHYLNHNEKLPKAYLNAMLAAKDFNQGIQYTRQLFYALLDLSFGLSNGEVDVTKAFNDLHQEIIGIPTIEGGHFNASFGHLMGGYDSGYYGYLWSEVYADDLFTRFNTEGLLNSSTGADYRSIILESGDMRNASDLIEGFLGRESNSDAFFKKLGITN